MYIVSAGTVDTTEVRNEPREKQTRHGRLLPWSACVFSSSLFISALSPSLPSGCCHFFVQPVLSLTSLFRVFSFADVPLQVPQLLSLEAEDLTGSDPPASAAFAYSVGGCSVVGADRRQYRPLPGLASFPLAVSWAIRICACRSSTLRVELAVFVSLAGLLQLSGCWSMIGSPWVSGLLCLQ